MPTKTKSAARPAIAKAFAAAIVFALVTPAPATCQSSTASPLIIEWQKSLGGTAHDWATSIQQTSDGGYVVTGFNNSNDGDVPGNHGMSDMWVVKLFPDGTLQWQKSLGGPGVDAGRSIRQTSDGGFIVAGESGFNGGDVTGHHGNLDMWVVKLDPDGALQWQRSLGGTGEDQPYSIRLTSDGGYVVAGHSASKDGDVTGNHGIDDIWVVKLTPDGSLMWQKSLGGTGRDWANSIQQTSDGGYVVAGESTSNNGDVTGNHDSRDMWVVKLAQDGALQWQRSLGGTDDDSAKSIQQTSDGGYVVVGYSASKDGDVTGNHGNVDMWVVKLAPDGSLLWQKSLGGTGDDGAIGIQQTSDGGYVVAGYSASNDGDVTGNHGGWDIWVVKLAQDGSLMWQMSLGGAGFDCANSIQLTSDGGYVVASSSDSKDGDVTENHGSDDIWVVKLVHAGAGPDFWN